MRTNVRRRGTRFSLLAIAASLVLAPGAPAQNFVASRDAPVPGQPKWIPSFAFPQSSPPASDPKPWLAIDPFTSPEGYAKAVLAYFMEGQNTSSWRVQNNPVRKWYHMPWMHLGSLGREVIHGLTRERNAAAGTLAPTQHSCTQTWSIGFFNPIGGHQLWKTWNDGTSAPDFSSTAMPEGTVVVKLLFNEASPTEVPYLKRSPTLKANVAKRPAGNAAGSCVDIGVTQRTPGNVRLVQLDIAVKDSRAPVTNWFFGTFVYRNEAPATKAWSRLVPVGLMWGNDPNLSDAAAQGGQAPTESVVLNTFGFTEKLGRGGRLNGPLDNRSSTCISCHMTAQKPNSAPLFHGAGWDTAKCWFRNLPPTQAFGDAPTATTPCGHNDGSLQSFDFSLQLQVGWRNWRSQQPAGPPAPPGPVPHAAIPAPAGGDPLLQPLIIDGRVSQPLVR
jgi:hypothetical protein